MTADLALLVSLIAIACAVWWYFHSKTKRPVCRKVCDKIRKLRSLEEAVKSQGKEMKDD